MYANEWQEKKPPLERQSAVASTQAQVVNSNLTSTGKETHLYQFFHLLTYPSYTAESDTP